MEIRIKLYIKLDIYNIYDLNLTIRKLFRLDLIEKIKFIVL